MTMSAPPSAAIGQDVDFVAVVTNRGVAATPVLTVVDRFDAGLQHASSAQPGIRALNLESIPPGQSQRVVITLRPTQPGQLCNTLEIHDAGGNVLANAQACVAAAAPGAPVARQTITVKKTGPAQVAAGQVADFVIEVTNASQSPATQLRVADSYDRAMSPISATYGHAWENNDEELVWHLDTLPPGKSVRYQIRCECPAPVANACNRVTVTTDEGASASDQACLQVTAAAAPPRRRPARHGYRSRWPIWSSRCRSDVPRRTK